MKIKKKVDCEECHKTSATTIINTEYVCQRCFNDLKKENRLKLRGEIHGNL